MIVSKFFGIILVCSCVVSESMVNVLVQSNLEKHKGVKYLTFSKLQPEVAVDIRDVLFVESSKTVFVVHGYYSKSLDHPYEIKNAIFETDLGVGHVVVVSWMAYSSHFNYFDVAASYVPKLADDINKKIQHILQDRAGTVQIIGHSLGSHVAGQTGRLLKSETGKEIDLIIGKHATI